MCDLTATLPNLVRYMEVTERLANREADPERRTRLFIELTEFENGIQEHSTHCAECSRAVFRVRTGVV